MNVFTLSLYYLDLRNCVTLTTILNEILLFKVTFQIFRVHFELIQNKHTFVYQNTTHKTFVFQLCQMYRCVGKDITN